MFLVGFLLFLCLVLLFLFWLVLVCGLVLVVVCVCLRTAWIAVWFVICAVFVVYGLVDNVVALCLWFICSVYGTIFCYCLND